jgi:hypothetical protein
MSHWQRSAALPTRSGEASFVSLCLSFRGAVRQLVVVVCQSQHNGNRFGVFYRFSQRTHCDCTVAPMFRVMNGLFGHKKAYHIPHLKNGNGTTAFGLVISGASGTNWERSENELVHLLAEAGGRS